MAIGRARAGDILRGRSTAACAHLVRGEELLGRLPPAPSGTRPRQGPRPSSFGLSRDRGFVLARDRGPPVSLGFDLELQNFAVIHRAVALGHVLD